MIRRTVDRQQPWIADIVFDGEDMVFSLADRSGHQEDQRDQSPGGEILRACWTGSAWSLESDGVCDGATTFGNYGYNNQDGPGGGLFYWDQNGREGNNTMGALAQVPGYNNVVTVGTDVARVRRHDGRFVHQPRHRRLRHLVACLHDRQC